MMGEGMRGYCQFERLAREGMVEDGFRKACDDEPRDWWMPLFGMAPCQALINRQSSLQLFAVSAWEKETMAQQMLLLTVVSVWLFAGYFLAEATYYNHHIYNRYRALNHHANMDNQLPPEVPVAKEEVAPRPVNFSRTFYGIMFDAGSTGTRIHIYKFIQKDPDSVNGCPLHLSLSFSLSIAFSLHPSQEPAGHSTSAYFVCVCRGSFTAWCESKQKHRGGKRKERWRKLVELPVLDNEMYHAVKPGLSAYADMPAMGGETIRQLLKVAKKTIPKEQWIQTPVVLKATAGLRLLPQEKAKALLDEVKEIFDDSPFFVPNNSVTIMNGTNEGVLAWVTVNFLTGHLYAKTKRTVGILDLGGGSTQITFLPRLKKTVLTAPEDYIARINMFNSTFELYTHSYLGNGLIAARLATLGALGADGLDWKVFRSSCLPKKFREDWSFGGLTYKVSGIPDGFAGYKLCYQEVLRVVKGIVHQPFEVKGSSIFYAFSYYYDRAVESGLIDGSRGGTVEVRDFKKRAKEVDTSMRGKLTEVKHGQNSPNDAALLCPPPQLLK
ncbi:Ectonucleoside triphosphate diphosphohydrolase 5 [Labeo rohita]|uniref:nucleoside diphosphate phosphatase n=1 Tax=Labeo rohita TaxID=84645 RepID=A0ABQ8LV82_LABRO|nr:Ectonucleoside triphosphate diphosphohydrolase 5 [Labeo rohita]